MAKAPVKTTLTDVIKVGDSVYLKSGSPKMCVAAILADGFIKCVWSQYDAQTIAEHTFPTDTLRKVD